MPNGTYGGVRGKETKVGQKTFVSQPIRLLSVESNPWRDLISDWGRGCGFVKPHPPIRHQVSNVKNLWGYSERNFALRS